MFVQSISYCDLLPVTMISTVAVPTLPRASVIVQVWFPESTEWREDSSSVGVLPRSTKQFPKQVEDHW